MQPQAPALLLDASRYDSEMAAAAALVGARTALAKTADRPRLLPALRLAVGGRAMPISPTARRHAAELADAC